MKAIPISLFLLVLACVPVRALAASPHHHAVPAPRWKSCAVHLTWDYSGVSYARCHRYHIAHAPGRVIGSWTATRYVSPHIRRWLRYPRFAHPAPAPARPEPTGNLIQLSVSAYSWGCGASGAMADGRMPYVGAAAGIFPFGTRLTVPGFGTVTVEDRGVPSGYLDLFVSSCAAAWQWGRQSLMVRVDV